MRVEIPRKYREFVQGAIDRGSFKNQRELLAEALRLLQKRERLLRDVNAGIQQLEHGLYRDYDSAGLRAKLDEVKTAGRRKTKSKRKDS